MSRVMVSSLYLLQHNSSLEGCNVEFIRQKLQLVALMKKSKLYSIWLQYPLAILLMTSVRACWSFNGLDSDEFLWGSISHSRSGSEPLSFIILTGTRPMVTRSVKAPVSKPQAATSSLQKLPLCDKCGTGIVWVFSIQHETAQMVSSLKIYYQTLLHWIVFMHFNYFIKWNCFYNWLTEERWWKLGTSTAIQPVSCAQTVVWTWSRRATFLWRDSCTVKPMPECEWPHLRDMI